MKQIILHIGTPKTGTTSIQVFLDSAQKYLLSQGCLYPTEGRLKAGVTYCVHRPEGIVTKSGPVNNHHLLAWTLMEKVDGMNADCCWLDVLNEIYTTQAKIVILSSEDFSLLSDKQIIQIRKYLEGFSVKVVIYLRNIFNKMLSGYTQWIKMGRYHRSFRCFIDEMSDRKQHNYNLLINRWSDIFGQDNIEIKLFDKIKQESGITQDIIETLHLKTIDFEQYLSRKETLNISPSYEVINAILFLNRIEHSLSSPSYLNKRFKYIREKLLHASSTNYSFLLLKPFFNQSISSKEERLILKEKVKEWYPYFVSKYVNPEDRFYFEF